MKSSHRINLLPTELHPKLERPLDWAMGMTVGFTLTFIASSTTYHKMHARSQLAELAGIAAKHQEVALKLDPLFRQVKKEERQNQRLVFIESVLDRKNRWSEAFKEFSRVLPHGVWFTGLSSATIEGSRRFVIKGEATSQGKMAEFFSELEHSRLFSGSTINYSEREPNVEPEVYRFELSVPIRGDQPGGSA